MGHSAGWLALSAGIAGGGDVILVPEIAWKEEVVADYLGRRRAEEGKPYSIVVVAEGIPLPKEAVDGRARGALGHPTCRRAERLGAPRDGARLHPRGGGPSPNDRVLATRLGAAAATLIAKGKFGRMVALRGGEVTSIALRETAGKLEEARVPGPPPDGQRGALARRVLWRLRPLKTSGVPLARP